ncbi:MAG: PspC domain-containing protein [Pseudomonadales bacterium]
MIKDDEGIPVRRLRLDPRRRRIAGVCAGIARYFDLETWVVRLAAITLLIFLPSITLPAYLIAWLLLERPRDSDAFASSPRSNRAAGNRRFGAAAPELGSRHAPRQVLRDVRADLAAVELRLRRMEGHVTSARYTLDRELRALDTADSDRRGRV